MLIALKPLYKKKQKNAAKINATTVLLVKLLVQKLVPGGYLHLATDWEDYAHHMLEVLTEERGLNNTPEAANGFSPRPEYRGSSSFERKGLAKGHGVWDLVFVKK